MARNTSFLALVTSLKEETGRSSETNVGVDDEDTLKTVLNRWYEALWYSYDWPHLLHDFSVPLVAGDYQYDLPSGLDLERIEKVSLKYNGMWRPILRGIEYEDYNIFDPTADVRCDPVLKWDVRTDDEGNLQLEVWPVPATAQTLGFKGFRQFARLVADDDICYLDDVLVVSFAAAQILKRQESEDADDMLSFANKHFNTLRDRGKSGDTCYQMGLGYDPAPKHPRASVVIAGS